MAEITNEDFFAAILASDILVPYLQQDEGLAALLRSPSHPDVHYFANAAPAKELVVPLKQRLNVMAARKISHNFEATKQLVDFMEEHPDSLIHNVTFNGPTRHYGVRCAVVGNQLHVICVMTGGHIPDELLGESLQ